MPRLLPMILGVAVLLADAAMARSQDSPLFTPPTATPSTSQPVIVTTPVPVYVNNPYYPNQHPGWVFGAELGLLIPNVAGDQRSGDMSIAAVPEFMAGYQFFTGRILYLSYRFIESGQITDTGQNVVAFQGFDGGGNPIFAPTEITQTSRVDAQRLDLNFRFLDNPWNAFMRSRWELGIRAASVFVDQKVTGFNIWDGGSWLSMHFLGMGPHANYRFSAGLIELATEGFIEADNAFLFGTQKYQARPLVGLAPGQSLQDSTIQPLSYGLFTYELDLRAGLTFTPYFLRHVWRISAGYEYDLWLFAGGVDTIPSGPGRLFPDWRFRYITLSNRGPFLRVEFQY
ncbi:MAG TPA: hypothetical protein VKS79_07060 [Gemmataceae bacterium]|nr:hypothetical protein [Gemmataceae bacterium]